MASVPVKKDGIVPLHLQLDGFETGLFPQAIVKDDTGAVFAVVDMADMGDGLYLNSALSMPAKNLFATYKTYEDAGHAVVRDNEAGIDLFVLSDFTAVNRKDKIYGILANKQSISGQVKAKKLSGIIAAGAMLGTLKKREQFIGQLSDNVIAGKVHRQ